MLPRVVQPWMKRLLRPAIEHLATLPHEPESKIDELRQLLARQGDAGVRLAGMIEKKGQRLYKTVHDMMTAVRSHS